jgi:Ca2+-binding RTX toxin-like protein
LEFAGRIHGPLLIKLGGTAVSTSIELRNLTFTNAVTVLGGAANDNFSLIDAITMGPVKFDGGLGNDKFLIESGTPGAAGSTLLGTVLIKGGAGDDVVMIAGAAASNDILFAAKLITVDGGAGADSVSVGTGATLFIPIKLLAIPLAGLATRPGASAN